MAGNEHSLRFLTLLSPPPERILLSNAVGWVIRDAFPVSPGHKLVTPKRHVGSFFDLADNERNGLMALLAEARVYLNIFKESGLYRLIDVILCYHQAPPQTVSRCSNP